MRKITTLAGWLFPLILLATLTFIGSQLTFAQKFQSLPYLAHGLLAVAVLLGAQFGHSRLAWLAIGYLLLLLQPSLQALIGVESQPLASLGPIVLLLHGWLIWRPDKGFRPLNVLQTLVELAIVATLLLFLNGGFNQHPAASMAAIRDLFYQGATTMTEAMTPGLVLFFLLMTVTNLVRSLWFPSLTHSVVLISSLGLGMGMVWPHFGLGAIALATAVVAIAAIMLDSYHMAFRDELTEIPSRRALMNYVQTLGRRYTVVMGDVDHFKKFNDTYGHDVGDQVLRMVASRLRNVAGGGRAFRYGGEEFTLIFAGKSAHQAKPFVEAIREEIAHYQMAIRSKDRPKKQEKGQRQKGGTASKNVHVTMSFGIAEKQHKQQSFPELLKSADIALYQAKKAGRNCVK